MRIFFILSFVAMFILSSTTALVNPFLPNLSFEPDHWIGNLESPSPFLSCPSPPRVLINVNGVSEYR
jgi:hypothetical protein